MSQLFQYKAIQGPIRTGVHEGAVLISAKVCKVLCNNIAVASTVVEACAGRHNQQKGQRVPDIVSYTEQFRTRGEMKGGVEGGVGGAWGKISSLHNIPSPFSSLIHWHRATQTLHQQLCQHKSELPHCWGLHGGNRVDVNSGRLLPAKFLHQMQHNLYWCHCNGAWEFLRDWAARVHMYTVRRVPL